MTNDRMPEVLIFTSLPASLFRPITTSDVPTFRLPSYLEPNGDHGWCHLSSCYSRQCCADASCSANQTDDTTLDVTAETAKAAATTAMDNVKSFIAGGAGGASAVLVGTH